MTSLEQRVAADHGCDLVVFDGPLRGRNDPCGVGYVKTQHVQYLPDELVPVLGRLGDGERTPLVLIGDRGSLVALELVPAPAGPRSHPLSGVVRCELPGRRSGRRRRRPRRRCVGLPAPLRQPAAQGAWAPQNLTPIAGLEHRLRHLLGDPVLLERSLRVAAAEPADLVL